MLILCHIAPLYIWIAAAWASSSPQVYPEAIESPSLGDDFEIYSFDRLDKGHEVGYHGTLRVLDRLPRELGAVN